MSGTEQLAQVDRLCKEFGHVRAVDDVTFSVAGGEVVGLLGANGAGKTTVIRMLLGLLAPTSGGVSLIGNPPDREQRRLVGYVPQSLGLYTDMTVMENVQFVAQAYGYAVPSLPPTIEPEAKRLVGDLSLGVQRQVAFLCALLHTPALLVLDEPTSGVDPVARAELWDTIRDQAAEGVGVLVTTHYMQEAEQCDRLLLMSNGRLVGAGSVDDIIAGTTAVQIAAADWSAAFAALDAAGMPVTLEGRCVRVADRQIAGVAEVLRAASVSAEVTQVPATIAERMTVLSLAES